MRSIPLPLSLLRHAATAGLALFVGAACGDDPAVPGALAVKWTHGPTPTCGSRNVATIEARAYQRGEEIASAEAPCPEAERRGTVEIPELKPGTYDVEVEGFNGEGKGTYLAKAPRVSVKEAETTETAELLLAEKPARLRVDWLPPGGKCATAGITDVEVSLTYNAGTSAILEVQTEVPCDNVFTSPDDPAVQLAGVLLTDLTPNPDVVVFVYGKNAGGDRIAQGQAGPRAVNSGDDEAIVIDLATCPGTPPACN